MKLSNQQAPRIRRPIMVLPGWQGGTTVVSAASRAATHGRGPFSVRLEVSRQPYEADPGNVEDILLQIKDGLRETVLVCIGQQFGPPCWGVSVQRPVEINYDCHTGKAARIYEQSLYTLGQLNIRVAQQRVLESLRQSCYRFPEELRALLQGAACSSVVLLNLHAAGGRFFVVRNITANSFCTNDPAGADWRLADFNVMKRGCDAQQTAATCRRLKAAGPEMFFEVDVGDQEPQLRATQAADVFAYGTMLYEMLGDSLDASAVMACLEGSLPSHDGHRRNRPLPIGLGAAAAEAGLQALAACVLKQVEMLRERMRDTPADALNIEDVMTLDMGNGSSFKDAATRLLCGTFLAGRSLDEAMGQLQVILEAVGGSLARLGKGLKRAQGERRDLLPIEILSEMLKVPANSIDRVQHPYKYDVHVHVQSNLGWLLRPYLAAKARGTPRHPHVEGAMVMVAMFLTHGDWVWKLEGDDQLVVRQDITIHEELLPALRKAAVAVLAQNPLLTETADVLAERALRCVLFMVGPRFMGWGLPIFGWFLGDVVPEEAISWFPVIMGTTAIRAKDRMPLSSAVRLLRHQLPADMSQRPEQELLRAVLLAPTAKDAQAEFVRAQTEMSAGVPSERPLPTEDVKAVDGAISGSTSGWFQRAYEQVFKTPTTQTFTTLMDEPDIADDPSTLKSFLAASQLHTVQQLQVVEKEIMIALAAACPCVTIKLQNHLSLASRATPTQAACRAALRAPSVSPSHWQQQPVPPVLHGGLHVPSSPSRFATINPQRLDYQSSPSFHASPVSTQQQQPSAAMAAYQHPSLLSAAHYPLSDSEPSSSPGPSDMDTDGSLSSPEVGQQYSAHAPAPASTSSFWQPGLTAQELLSANSSARVSCSSVDSVLLQVQTDMRYAELLHNLQAEPGKLSQALRAAGWDMPEGQQENVAALLAQHDMRAAANIHQTFSKPDADLDHWNDLYVHVHARCSGQPSHPVDKLLAVMRTPHTNPLFDDANIRPSAAPTDLAAQSVQQLAALPHWATVNSLKPPPLPASPSNTPVGQPCPSVNPVSWLHTLTLLYAHERHQLRHECEQQETEHKVHQRLRSINDQVAGPAPGELGDVELDGDAEDDDGPDLSSVVEAMQLVYIHEAVCSEMHGNAAVNTGNDFTQASALEAQQHQDAAAGRAMDSDDEAAIAAMDTEPASGQKRARVPSDPGEQVAASSASRPYSSMRSVLAPIAAFNNPLVALVTQLNLELLRDQLTRTMPPLQLPARTPTPPAPSQSSEHLESDMQAAPSGGELQSTSEADQPRDQAALTSTGLHAASAEQFSAVAPATGPQPKQTSVAQASAADASSASTLPAAPTSSQLLHQAQALATEQFTTSTLQSAPTVHKPTQAQAPASEPHGVAPPASISPQPTPHADELLAEEFARSTLLDKPAAATQTQEPPPLDSQPLLLPHQHFQGQLYANSVLSSTSALLHHVHQPPAASAPTNANQHQPAVQAVKPAVAAILQETDKQLLRRARRFARESQQAIEMDSDAFDVFIDEFERRDLLSQLISNHQFGFKYTKFMVYKDREKNRDKVDAAPGQPRWQHAAAHPQPAVPAPVASAKPAAKQPKLAEPGAGQQIGGQAGTVQQHVNKKATVPKPARPGWKP